MQLSTSGGSIRTRLGGVRPGAVLLRWVRSLTSLIYPLLAFCTAVLGAGNQLPRGLMGEKPEEIVLAGETSALME